MEHYLIKDAQQDLKKLLDDARLGHTVIIIDEDNQAVQLTPVEIDPLPRKRRKAGSLRGQIHMSDDFDAPLDDFAEYME